MSNTDNLSKQILDLEKAFHWLEDQTSNKEIKDSIKSEKERKALACMLLQHSLGIMVGILILLKNEILSPVFTLPRPFFEAYVNSIWVSECAEITEINDIYNNNRKLPSLNKAIGIVNKKKSNHAPFINKVKTKLQLLHGWTHGGTEHLVHLFDGTNIKPNYPVALQSDLLYSFVRPLLYNIAVELLLTFYDSVQAEEKCTKIRALLQL